MIRLAIVGRLWKDPVEKDYMPSQCSCRCGVGKVSKGVYVAKRTAPQLNNDTLWDGTTVQTSSQRRQINIPSKRLRPATSKPPACYLRPQKHCAHARLTSLTPVFHPDVPAAQ